MTTKSTLEFTDILYEKAGGIATVMINRADTYNSVTQHSLEELSAAFRDAGEDDEIGVIIFTGAGEKAFCSGGHMQSISERTSGIKRNHLRVMAGLALQMRTCGKPVIAAVNGFAIGLFLEGPTAWLEKRKPNFRTYRKRRVSVAKKG